LNGTNAYEPTVAEPPLTISAFRLVDFLRKRWVYHTIFWVCYFGFYVSVIFFSIYKVKDPIVYLEMFVFFPFEIALAYFNIYVLIPKFLASRKYFSYVFAVIAAILFGALINMLLKQLWTSLGSNFYVYVSTFTLGNITMAIIERFYMVAFTTGVKMAKDWVVFRQQMQEKEKQYLEAELIFLKSQINPHFFFNTLNNLYSLTLKKSDEAPEVVLKLSSLMSYMLYESNAPKVLLDKEIEYLNNYLDVERLRFGSRLCVSFEIEGKTEGIKIPPMILILFVENSFKHGSKNNINKVEISLHLKADNGEIHFEAKNNFSVQNAQTDYGGIGLKNVRRRLDLLYGKNYILQLGAEGNIHTVILKFPYAE
jgi:two-component system LytT family sensor kinase